MPAGELAAANSVTDAFAVCLRSKENASSLSRTGRFRRVRNQNIPIYVASPRAPEAAAGAVPGVAEQNSGAAAATH